MQTEVLQLPPAYLSDRSQQLWEDIVVTKRKHMISPGRVVLLEQALTALDRADEARDVIKKEGMTTKNDHNWCCSCASFGQSRA